jgi:hypothetical protein
MLCSIAADCAPTLDVQGRQLTGIGFAGARTCVQVDPIRSKRNWYRVFGDISEATRRAPSDASTDWSMRKLAVRLDARHMMVAGVWRKHGLKPHGIERYLASNDPEWKKKAADIIGLYLNPAKHAAVFCGDEKTAIQSSGRKVPVLPLSPGGLEGHGYEYRHGTAWLYSVFIRIPERYSVTAARYTPPRNSSFFSPTSRSTNSAAKRSM